MSTAWWMEPRPKLNKGKKSRTAAELCQMEPAPHVRITLGGVTIGAASLKITFNNAMLNGDDINVYLPESTVRGAG